LKFWDDDLRESLNPERETVLSLKFWDDDLRKTLNLERVEGFSVPRSSL
jgi:hypothetical protein